MTDTTTIASTSYTPGSWLGIIGGSATVLLPPSEKSRAGALWALVDDGAGFDEVLDALVATGLSSLPGFVLVSGRVSPEGGSVRVVVRGPSVVSFETADGPVEVDGAASKTWVERTLDKVTRMSVALGDEKPSGDPLTVTGGLVRVAGLEVPPPAPEPGEDVPASRNGIGRSAVPVDDGSDAKDDVAADVAAAQQPEGSHRSFGAAAGVLGAGAAAAGLVGLAAGRKGDDDDHESEGAGDPVGHDADPLGLDDHEPAADADEVEEAPQDDADVAPGPALSVVPPVPVSGDIPGLPADSDDEPVSVRRGEEVDALGLPTNLPPESYDDEPDAFEAPAPPPAPSAPPGPPPVAPPPSAPPAPPAPPETELLDEHAEAPGEPLGDGYDAPTIPPRGPEADDQGPWDAPTAPEPVADEHDDYDEHDAPTGAFPRPPAPDLGAPQPFQAPPPPAPAAQPGPPPAPPAPGEHPDWDHQPPPAPPAPPAPPHDGQDEWVQQPPPAPPAPPADDWEQEPEDDHDGLTRIGAVEDSGAGHAGIPGQPKAPERTAFAVAHLEFSSGDRIDVDRVVLVGRAPEAARLGMSDHQPLLVTVPSPHQEISSTHCEIRPGAGVDHGAAVVTDLGSTNGTVLVQPGLGPENLRPGVPVQLMPGAVIDLGDSLTIRVTNP